jgi:hypothetical protein
MITIVHNEDLSIGHSNLNGGCRFAPLINHSISDEAAKASEVAV